MFSLDLYSDNLTRLCCQHQRAALCSWHRNTGQAHSVDRHIQGTGTFRHTPLNVPVLDPSWYLRWLVIPFLV